ncbi:MAG TPA: dTDP-4-dehydrorhamnose reductase [Angustibacter sp.]|nr:dTDP-4-dehydrorhamnose reductase [Angustibacter sp.]
MSDARPVPPAASAVGRWLLVGGRGMLGQDVEAALRAAGVQPTVVGSPELDVRDAGACDAAVREHDVVVNCAAYTAVDDAETDEPEAFAVNALGAHHLALACARHGARLVHVSTDYVFAGTAREPYAEDAPVAPRSAYGRTKLAGEWAVQASGADALVVRTAWLYGAGGRCFPRTIAAALLQRDVLDVVADQVGQPTWAADVARVVLDLVRVHAPAGTYHATSAGQATWHDLAQAVARATGADPGRVRPTTSEQLVRPAPRPAYSVLGHDALRAVGVEPIGPWQQRFEAAAPVVLGAEAVAP